MTRDYDDDILSIMQGGMMESNEGRSDESRHLYYGRMKLKGAEQHVDYAVVPKGYFNKIDLQNGSNNVLKALGLSYPEMIITAAKNTVFREYFSHNRASSLHKLHLPMNELYKGKSKTLNNNDLGYVISIFSSSPCLFFSPFLIQHTVDKKEVAKTLKIFQTVMKIR